MNSPEFKLCIDDILRRIKIMGSVVDNNEVMRCEYISTILYTAISLLKGSGRVDHAIKKNFSKK